MIVLVLALLWSSRVHGSICSAPMLRASWMVIFAFDVKVKGLDAPAGSPRQNCVDGFLRLSML